MNKNMGYLGLEFFIKSVCSFVTIYILSYNLSQKDFGLIKYTLSVATMISAISLSGYASTIIRNISKYNYCNIENVVKKYASFSILTIIIVLITSIVIAKLESNKIGTMIFSAGIIIILNNIFVLFESILIGKQLFKIKCLMTILNVTTTLLTLIYLVLENFSISYILILPLTVTMAINVIYFIFTFAYTRKSFESKANIDEKEQYHLSFIKIIQRIANEIDQIILYQLMGPISLASYTVAVAPIKKISSSSVLFKNYILPKLCSMSTKQSTTYIVNIITRSIAPAIVLIVIYNIFAITLFDTIFPKYQQAKPLTQIFSIVLIFIFPISIFSQMLIAEMDLSKMYIFTTTIPASKIVLMIILIKYFNVLGAIVTIMIITALSLSVYIFFFYKLKASNSETYG